MITITPNAAEAVRTVVTKQKLPPDTPLRVGITRDGCEGSGTQFRYVMGLDPNPAKPGDQVFGIEGIRVVVDQESLPHLEGLQLDVQQTPEGMAFAFVNPRAKHSCGCGQTFSE